MSKPKKNHNPRGQLPVPGDLRLEIREYLDRNEIPKIAELAAKHDVRPQRASFIWRQELRRRGLAVQVQQVLTRDAGDDEE